MEQFEHNELTFQLMVEASPNALILVNNLGEIEYLNRFAEKLFQYTKKELTGKELTLLIPHNFKENHVHLMQSYFNNPVSRQMEENRELNALKKNGTEFPVEIGLNPIVTKDGILTLAAIIDITERKKTDRQFRLVVESAPNAIILVNSVGEIVMINKQTEQQFGYSTEELIGKNLEVLVPERTKINHPEYRNVLFANPQTRAMGSGRDHYAVRKDGTEFPVEIGLNPIETIEGTLILASVIDITPRKKHEEALKRNARKIEEKNKALELSEQKLRELNATKDRLFSIIGHDLRGPIGGFKQLIELMISDFDLTDTAILSETLQMIQGTANTTYDLLENLLLWSKSQQNEIVFSPANCNLYEIAEKSINLLQELAKQKKIEIFNKIPQDQIIFADVNMLMTVIRNLISNAIKFTHQNKCIYVSVEKDENFCTISVKDEGIGIGPENIEKIFNPNVNFTTYGTGNEKGSGLGLMLCKEFVEVHGGIIWVESDPGMGSDFKFTIPLD
nr:PAS domain S-box protein [Bacteroidota bacterium]